MSMVTSYRSSRAQMFLKIGVLNILKILGSLFNKVADLRLATFHKTPPDDC